MNRPLDAREWLELIYSKGVGVAADHALTLIELADNQDWFEANEKAIEELATAVDFKHPTDETEIQAVLSRVSDKLELLDEITRALTAAGAIDETSDIPATIRMVLGP